MLLSTMANEKVFRKRSMSLDSVDRHARLTIGKESTKSLCYQNDTIFACLAVFSNNSTTLWTLHLSTTEQ